MVTPEDLQRAQRGVEEAEQELQRAHRTLEQLQQQWDRQQGIAHRVEWIRRCEQWLEATQLSLIFEGRHHALHIIVDSPTQPTIRLPILLLAEDNSPFTTANIAISMELNDTTWLETSPVLQTALSHPDWIQAWHMTFQSWEDAPRTALAWIVSHVPLWVAASDASLVLTAGTVLQALEQAAHAYAYPGQILELGWMPEIRTQWESLVLQQDVPGTSEEGSRTKTRL